MLFVRAVTVRRSADATDVITVLYLVSLKKEKNIFGNYWTRTNMEAIYSCLELGKECLYNHVEANKNKKEKIYLCSVIISHNKKKVFKSMPL